MELLGESSRTDTIVMLLRYPFSRVLPNASSGVLKYFTAKERVMAISSSVFRISSRFTANYGTWKEFEILFVNEFLVRIL